MTETHPKISVVIPTYNRAALILKTLDSVFRQSYSAHEIIVVDNCSSDDTNEILEPLIQNRKIRYVRHDKNYERARSRNTGMANATGTFLCFHDSDDLMYPDCLSTVAKIISENPHFKLFHCLYELIDTEGNLIHKYRFPALKDSKQAIADGNFLSCIGVFLHRDIYQSFKFDLNPDFIGSEDYEFWLRVIASYDLYRIDKVLCGMVHHGGRSILHMDIDATARRRLKIIEKIRLDPGLSKAYAPYLSSLPAHAYAYVATVANSNAEYSKSLQYLLKAILSGPRVLLKPKFYRTFLLASLRINPNLIYRFRRRNRFGSVMAS